MNNLSSYCGLVNAKIRASDKDLPVPKYFGFNDHFQDKVVHLTRHELCNKARKKKLELYSMILNKVEKTIHCRYFYFNDNVELLISIVFQNIEAQLKGAFLFSLCFVLTNRHSTSNMAIRSSRTLVLECKCFRNMVIFENIWMKSGLNQDKVRKKHFIQILFRFFRNSLYPNLVQISS